MLKLKLYYLPAREETTATRVFLRILLGFEIGKIFEGITITKNTPVNMFV